MVVITVMPVSLLMTALFNTQLPVLPVTQLVAPPGEKLPFTVALATEAPLLMSRMVAVTVARQPLPLFADMPVNDLMATVVLAGSAKLPAASEYTSKLGDPVPSALSRLLVALLVRKEATAAGELPGLVANTSAATPATWGLAMDVPLMVLVAVALVCQAEVMLLPGPKISTQLP